MNNARQNEDRRQAVHHQATNPAVRSGSSGGAAAMKAPAVSVFLTVLNEQAHLAAAIESVLGQDYSGHLEVVIALGPSSDQTDAIARRFAAADERIKLEVNPSGSIPEGLNTAWQAGTGGILVRADGHTVFEPDYVTRCVAALEATGAVVVGGLMVPEGTTAFEQAVARAMSSRVGIGAASYHTGGQAGPAKSAYLGAYLRQPLAAVGGYDEAVKRGEDWELCHRLIQAGGLVWFDPSLKVTYRPRSNWLALVRQYHSTGRWRAEIMRRHPETISARYLAPPLVTALVAGGLGIGLLGLARRKPCAQAMSLPGNFILGETIAALLAGRGLEAKAKAWLPVVMATMHLAWGASFIEGLVRSPGRDS
ncbi:MAG: glycosyltransferase family 2 protein [Micrococcales bacterium]|nr:glycosyltransferase family 2 protein [Micrococcales bacterium]